MILRNRSVGFITTSWPRTLMVFLDPVMETTRSLRLNLMSENTFPVSDEAAASPTSNAWSQLTVLSDTTLLDTETTALYSVYPNGEWDPSHSVNTVQSWESRFVLHWRRSLCCSDVWEWTPEYSSRASHVGMLYGIAWTHCISELSVIHLPCVMPPDDFSSLISSCSIVWSEKLSLQKLLDLLIAK